MFCSQRPGCLVFRELECGDTNQGAIHGGVDRDSLIQSLLRAASLFFLKNG
jgi:hypothetical protein